MVSKRSLLAEVARLEGELVIVQRQRDRLNALLQAGEGGYAKGGHVKDMTEVSYALLWDGSLLEVPEGFSRVKWSPREIAHIPEGTREIFSNGESYVYSPQPVVKENWGKLQEVSYVLGNTIGTVCVADIQRDSDFIILITPSGRKFLNLQHLVEIDFETVAEGKQAVRLWRELRENHVRNA